MGNACGSKAGVSDTSKKVSAFKSADELKDYATFFPAGTKSALARCMTKEMWEEYKDMSDDSGVTFKTCIFSGVKNLDSGIGLYAGSHSSYTKFPKLFDAVVEDYHKHKTTDMHVSDMTSEGIENAEFDETDAAMIKSSRIRVGRNLDGYPLGQVFPRSKEMKLWLKLKRPPKLSKMILKVLSTHSREWTKLLKTN